jgi:DNA-binding CsgD family transcriptional regulator
MSTSVMTQRDETGLYRRSGDLTDSRVLLGMLRLLMARPQCDDIAQHLLLNVMASHDARAVIISVVGPGAAINPVGRFGIDSGSLEPFKSLSLWDSTPMSDAIRTGQPVVLASLAEVRAGYPWLGSDMAADDAIVVWPLALPDARVGAMQFDLSAAPVLEDLHATLNAVAPLLALYLSMRYLAGAAPAMMMPITLPEPGITSLDGAAHGPSEAHAPHPVRGSAAGGTSVGQLTERQSRILMLMARRLTNPQISREVGYSESTVRQETMAIYRFFGVSGRQEAVQVAGMRGMLNPQQSSPAGPVEPSRIAHLPGGFVATSP